MYDESIISQMNDYLYTATQVLSLWLSVMLPKSGEDWWEECVLSNLSYPQSTEINFQKLESNFDNHPLL